MGKMYMVLSDETAIEQASLRITIIHQTMDIDTFISNDKHRYDWRE